MIRSILIISLFLASWQQTPPSRSAKDYLDSGLVNLQKKDLDGAIKDVTKAIELNPHYVEAFLVRGQCLFLKRELDSALLDFDKVIELAPGMRGVERIYNTRSMIRVLNGDTEGALKDVEQAIALNPNYADAYSDRGVIRAFRNDQTGAASDYDKALALNPGLAVAYINRGILRYESGNLKGATNDFYRAVEIVPNTAKPHVDLAVLHTLAGEIDLAVGEIRKAFTLDPSSFSERDPGMASSPFKRLQAFIASNPNNARGYEARGLLRLVQGRRPEATEDFGKTLELNPKLRDETDRLTKMTF